MLTKNRRGNKMGKIFGKEELENLKSLKHDLLDPVKSFTKEVYDDAVGDAGRFYADKAQAAKREAAQAREKTKAQMAALRREQEEMRKRRNAAMKRAAITLALLALFSIIVISAALSAHAADTYPPRNPPAFEKAAAFDRAGVPAESITEPPERRSESP